VDRFAHVHLAWHDTRVSALNREIWSQEIPWGAEWDSTGALDVRISNGSGASTRPSLLADPAGSIFITWKDRRDGNSEIYFREGTLTAPVAVGDSPTEAGPALLASKNPFETETSFTLSGAPTGTTVDISIFSASGRLVRHLESGVAAGWDGRDALGAEAPAGVYFARATWPRRAAVTSVVKVR